MNLSRFAGVFGFLLCVGACTEDTSGGIDGADASGDNAQADAASDAMRTQPDALLPTRDGMITSPDARIADANLPDAIVADASPPDATLGDASIVVPDAAVECVSPDECSVPSNACSAAVLTVYEPTCIEGVCGARVRRGDCTANSPFCKGTSHITYAPQCSNETACKSGGNQNIEACTAPGDVCQSGELTTYTPTCDVTAGCDVTKDTSTCATPASLCKDLSFTSYAPNCADGANCGKGDPSVTTCTPRATTCSNGQITRYTAICDDAKGCGNKGTSASCPDAATICARGTNGIELITYEPTCNGSSCGKPVAKVELCTAAAPTCDGSTRVVESTLCDVKAEACDVNTTRTDCATTERQCIVQNFGSQCGVSWIDGVCDGAKGACAQGSGEPKSVVCKIGQKCTCSGTPGCV